ncbi:MAG: hypothetical protein R3C56_24465 [Pirellulaceae bacterium]
MIADEGRGVLVYLPQEKDAESV